MPDWVGLDPRLAWSLVALFVILVVASVVTWMVSRGDAGDEHRELKLRVRTWWVIAAVFGTALALGRTWSLAFFALVSFLAFKEYLSLIPTRRADRRVLFWAYLAIPLQYWWIHTAWYGMFIVFIPVWLFLFLPLRMILKGETEGFLRALSQIHWGAMTTIFCYSHAAYLMVLDPPVPGSPPGACLVLYLVFLTQFNDVAQYVWGKSLGRRKIVPKVSPNKTVAGFVGGVATTTALAVLLAGSLTPLDPVQALGAGLLIGIGGFTGDVTISAFKRDIGVKDSGSMLPGHGGVLDRIDSLTYTAPLFFHYIYWQCWPGLMD